MAQQFTILKWNTHTAGSLRGFCDVLLPSELIIHGVGIFQKDGVWFAMLPSKVRPGATDQNGKPKYDPVVSIRDKDRRERWGQLVIAALRDKHPEVFRGDSSGGASDDEIPY